MPILRILLLVLAAALAGAQTPPPSPTPAEADLSARIAALESLRPRYLNEKGEPANEQAVARLDEAVALLRAAQSLRQDERTLAADADGAPAQISAFQSELEAPLAPPDSLLPGADADLATLESAQRDIDERLQAVRTRLETIGRQRAERASRADAIPAELAAARAELEEADDRLAAASPDGESADLRRLADEAQREHALALAAKLETERRFITAVAPRRDLRQRLAEREIAQLTRAKELIAARIADARQRAAARQQAETRRAADDVPPELAPLGERLLALTREISRQVARLNALEAELAAARADAQAVAERESQIHARAASSPGGLQIGQLLLRARDALPDPAALRAQATRILREAGDLDDRAFELQTLIEETPRDASALRRILRDQLKLETPTETQLAAADDLLQRQARAAAELLDLINAPGRLITQAHEVAAAKAALAERVERLQRFIDARILWIRSEPAVARLSLRSAAGGLALLADPAQWRALWTAARERPLFLATGGVASPGLLAILVAAYIWIGRRLRAVNQRVQMPATDRFWLTPVAIALVAARAALLPLGLLALSRLFATLADQDLRLASWLAAGCARAAHPVCIGLFFIFLLRPAGVAESHFRWPPASTASVRRHVAWYTLALAAVAFFVAGARAADHADAIVATRFVVLAAMALTAAFFALVLRPHGPLMEGVVNASLWRGWRWAWPALWFAIVGAFIALGALHALGWTFSAAALARRLFDTAVVIAAVALARAVLLRWMAIARRRLAFEQHRRLLESMAQAEQRAESSDIPAQKGDEDDMVAGAAPPPTLDLSAIQRQARQLVALGSWTLGALLVLPIWRDIAPALERVDSIRLFPFTAPHGETAQSLRDSGRYVLSLADILGAALALFVGSIAVRNVPPLFDGFILSRTRLDVGARYAATTLTRYALLAALGLIVLSSLGFTGRSLGWAIAGLSVGLGLGLQEFVGNLVAGLSLLFERSVRPGDRIAVGGVEGVVKSMSIRATVLTDWDRRDVVIPNRKLIADTVVNETRTDMSGRAIIRIGVAYGTDTRLVERLLLETVRRHPSVQDALCTFDTFGDNALNFTLRVYIADISQRLSIVNDLHHGVAEVFRRHKIEISFPQRDLHIRDGSIDIRLVDQRQPTPRPGSAPQDD